MQHAVSYRPRDEGKAARRSLPQPTLMQGHAADTNTLVLDFAEDGNGPLGPEAQKTSVSDANFRVLRRLEEEDVEFMVYYDLYERELEDKDAIIAETEQEIEIPYEPIRVDPLTFFNNALIFDPKNNGVEGTGAIDLELSFQSLSEIAVERFLAPKDRLLKTNSFLKPWEMGSVGLTQGNYSAVWYQDLDDSHVDKIPVSKGDYFLQNIEVFPWTRKKFRFKEFVPLTDEEKKYRPYTTPEIQKQILLDPKIHRTMEKLSEYRMKLKAPGLGKKEFLANLEAMQVNTFHQTLFTASHSKILTLNSEVRFVNKQISSKNHNLETSVKTLDAERKEAEQSHAEFINDQRRLASLRVSGPSDLESLSLEAESVRLRMELEALAESSEKVKGELV
jgi:hypothetical protein